MKPIPMAALIKRELLTNLRNWRSFGLVVLTLGFATFLTYFNLEDSVTLNEAGNTAQSIFFTFTAVLLGACFLFIAPVAAISVCTEKQEDTFTLLQLTYLTPTGIILGKAINTVGLYLILIIASFPIIGTLFFLVGIDWIQFAMAMVLLVLTAITVTMIGVLCSTWFVNSIAAIFATFLGMLGLLMGLPVFVIGSPRGIASLAQADPSLWVFVPTAAFEIIISIVCFLGARQSLFFTPPPLPQEHTARALTQHSPGPTRPPMLGQFRVLSERYDFSRAWNPVYLKELAATAYMRRALFVVSIPFLAILFLAVGVQMGSGSNGVVAGGRWILVQSALIALIAPGLVATAIAREFAQQSIDMLRMALLSPAQVVLGHLGAALTALAPVFLAMLVGAAPIVFATLPEPQGILVLACVLVSTLITVAISIGIALVAAVLARRATTGILAGYGLSLLLVLGLSALVNAIFETVFYRKIDPEVANGISSQFSPLLSAWYALDSASDLSVFFGLWAPAALIYAALSVLFVIGAIRIFYRVQLREH